MRNFFLLIIITLFSVSACKSQDKTERRVIYNKDFKWSIAIPANFDTVSAAQWATLQQRGEDAVEATHDLVVENNAKTLFVFKNDQFNYFESNYQPFDSLTEGSYFESFKEVNDLIYETFKVQMEGAQLDSTYSVQRISGLDFQTLKIVIKFPNQVIMNWYMYCRLFGNREFTVNIATVDKQKEKELLDAWLNSKFGK